MCGIGGWLSTGSDLTPEEATLRAMSRTMECRGPDAHGLWFSRGIALIHRRLAILDLPGGAQPMVLSRSDGTKVAISYSGETYNYRDLRTELEDAGYSFSTASDTEVVLAAYAHWGSAQMLHRLTGMFALAIWDERESQLLLARDRLGVKPLHYATVGADVIFGSEPKALLAHPGVHARVDEDGLVGLFAMFGVHRPGQTVLHRIEEVPAGCYVEVDARGVRRHRYWKLAASEHTDTATETVERVRALLHDAVGGQLESDVPLCSLLSGGLDSAAVSALAQARYRERGQGLSTFTVDFADLESHFVPDADRPAVDAPYAAATAAFLHTEHSRVEVPVRTMADLQARATRARDLPAMGDLDSSLLSLFTALRDRFTVALSGESADEVFGGYAWFHDQRAVARDGFPWMMDDLGLANLLRPDLQDRIDPIGRVRDTYRRAVAAVPKCDSGSGRTARMQEVSHLALTHFLPVLLDRKDRTSMAVGVEVRVPFCDHRLIEYVWNIPWDLKVGDPQRPVPKHILREAVRGLVPDEIVDRPKAMFPAVADPSYDTLVNAAVSALLDQSDLGQLLDHERVIDLVEGRSQRPRWMQRMALGYLVQMDLWLCEYDVEVML